MTAQSPEDAERAGDCYPKIVEQQILGALNDFARHVLGIERVRKMNERSSYGLHGFSVPHDAAI